MRFYKNIGNKFFWKRYYYRYLDFFLDFLTPKDASVLFIDEEKVSVSRKADFLGEEKYEYVVGADITGYLEDVQLFLNKAGNSLKENGRIVLTQYSALWEPVLRLSSLVGLRKNIPDQNWISLSDLKNFAELAGLELVKSGTKMVIPVYIPFLSAFLNRFVANLPLFSRLGMFHYVVLRKKELVAEKPSLSVVVPARNEAGTIEKIVKELPELGSFTEIIFVEGNSKDNTFEEIKKVAEKYKNQKKIIYAKQDGRGKGDAVRKGFEMASGEIITIYDADMTVPADEMVKFYDSISKNRADFINGSRLVYPLEKQSMRLLNFFGNKFFGLAFSFVLGQPLKDTLCGTKMLWKKDYEKIKKGRTFFGDFDPFGDFDLLFGASKLNLKILDLPIHYKERKYGETNISRFKHGWLLLKMVFFSARKIKFI